jgi:molybdate transport system permease protein
MTPPILDTLILTLKVALTATLSISPPGIALAYLLARCEFRGRTLLSSVALAPLVLPPTAIGYLLLRLFAFDGPLGRRSLGFDLGILLTWRGAVLASSVMSMPLVVRTARLAFEDVDPRLEQMAHTLGYGGVATFCRFTVPIAKRGLVAAALLGFVRSIGEFGATITIAGNIPGRTQTLASSIYSAEQSGDQARATLFLGIALLFGYAAVIASELLSRRPASAPNRRSLHQA